MKGYRLTLTLAVWGLMSGSSWGSLGLTPERTETIPELTGRIYQAAVADLDGDGINDLIACDFRRVAARSSSDGSALFSFDLMSDVLDAEFLIADVNRDSIPDLVIGQYFDYAFMPPDTVCRVDLFDGASGFIQHDSCFYTIQRTGSEHLLSPVNIIELAADDYDSDGYNELRVGYSSYRIYQMLDSWRLNSNGANVTYHSFPDETDTSENGFACDRIEFMTPDSAKYAALTRYEASVSKNPSAQTYASKLFARVEICNDSGRVVAALREDPLAPCSGATTELICSYRSLDFGNFDPGNPTAGELLVEYTAGYLCEQDGESSFDSTAHRYELYPIGSDGAPDSPRSLSEMDGLACPKYLDSFGGSLFALDANSVYQIQPMAGDIQSIGVLPAADTIMWSHGYESSDDYLVSIQGRLITWYRIDQVTDVEDIPENLPLEFRLGNAYPNPFNAVVTIPITVPKSGHLSVEVLNVLGQTVYTSQESSQRAGIRTLRWDAGGFGSGVYFIRAIFDGQTRTTRAVLLK